MPDRLQIVGEAIRRLSLPIPLSIGNGQREILKDIVDANDNLMIKPIIDIDPFCLPGEDHTAVTEQIALKGEGKGEATGPDRHLFNPTMTYKGQPYTGPRTMPKLTKMLQSGSYLTVSGEAVPLYNGGCLPVNRTKVSFKIGCLRNIKEKGPWSGLWVQSILHRNWYRVTVNGVLITLKQIPKDHSGWKGTEKPPPEPSLTNNAQPISPHLLEGINVLLTRIAVRFRGDAVKPLSLSNSSKSALLAHLTPSNLLWAAPEILPEPIDQYTVTNDAKLLSYLALLNGRPTTKNIMLKKGCSDCFLIGTTEVSADDGENLDLSLFGTRLVYCKVASVEKISTGWVFTTDSGVRLTTKEEEEEEEDPSSEEEDSSSSSSSSTGTGSSPELLAARKKPIEKTRRKTVGKRKADSSDSEDDNGTSYAPRGKWAPGEKWFSRPQDMFDDMAKTIEEKWPEPMRNIKELTKNRKIRVATMCSGTEAPLLALSMFQKGAGFEFFEHVFSCEIEPFKQAYIERNFSPKILFRDIRELGNSHASTAYGATVRVPTEVDVLVAGTVCKDFSLLNKFQKGLDDDGQSGMTFRGMLDWVKRSVPKVVILENVSHAPWDEINAAFRNLDLPNGQKYSTRHIKVDTKYHYLPQTRERGYLCATLGDKKHLCEWNNIIRGLQSNAPSNFTDYLLTDDDPMVVRARDKSVKKEKKEVNWLRCEMRHAKERAINHLGQQRPLTKWDGKGHQQPIDWFWKDWIGSMTDRVRDTIEIRYLKGLRDSDDALFRSAIWNLACNVDRGHCSKQGIVPCLTPSMIPFLTSRGGPLVGAEALAIQGIPIEDLSLTRESEKQLKDLAGNAMTTTVVGACIMSALLTVYQAPLKAAKKRRLTETTCQSPVKSNRAPTVKELTDATEHAVLPLSIPEATMKFLIEHAHPASLHCACEAFSTKLTRNSLYRCSECGYSACGDCKGNPIHDYVTVTPKRSDPTALRDMLLQALPLCITIHVDDSPKPLQNAIFQLKKVRRTRKWVAEYWTDDRKFHTHATLDTELKGITWRVYETNKRVPIVVVSPQLTTVYKRNKTLELSLKGTEYKDPWVVQLGVTVDFPSVPSVLEVTCNSEWAKGTMLAKKIAGTYHLLPKCGGPMGVLYRRFDEDCYFFKDLLPLGTATEDVFCFAETYEKLPVGLHRDFFGTSPPGWSLSDKPQKLKICVPEYVESKGGVRFNQCIEVSNLQHLPNIAQSTCSDPFVMTKLSLDPRVPIAAKCETWTSCSNADMSWAVSSLTIPDIFTNWVKVAINGGLNVLNCTKCSPPKPTLKWGKRLTEDEKEATAYEQALKARPKAFTVQKRALASKKKTEIRVALNPMAVIHRATQVLTTNINDTIETECEYSWRVVSDADVQKTGELVLVGNRTDPPHKNPPELNEPFRLRVEQLRSLSWMISRENDNTPFRQQEIVSQTISGWSVEGRATCPKTLRGGALADEVGYGKTVVSLSLIASDHNVHPTEYYVDAKNFTKSKATLVIVPPHLMSQWPDEVEKFLPPSTKIVILKNKSAFDRATLNTLCTSDIVLLSTTLLTRSRLDMNANTDIRKFRKEYYEFLDTPKETRALKLEHITWKRIIVDEYTFLKDDQYIVVERLRAHHKWLLSGTPDTSSFNEVSKIASLLGIHLGVRAEVKLTDAEKFHSLRTVKSGSWKEQRYKAAQRFLDMFVRKNIAEIDELPITVTEKRFNLSRVHSIVYQQMETAAQSLPADSAAEALLNAAATHESDSFEQLLSNKRKRICDCKENLLSNLNAALDLRALIRRKTNEIGYNGKFENWEQGALAEDDNAAKTIKEIIKKAEGRKVKNGKKTNEPKGTDDELKYNLDEQTHKLRSIARELVENTRSVRFMQHAMAKKLQCEICDKQQPESDTRPLCISSTCGHVAHLCHIDERLEDGHDGCFNKGCAAILKRQYLYPYTAMNGEGGSVETKMVEMTRLVAELLAEDRSERVILFSQFNSLTEHILSAFKKAKIGIGCITENGKSCLDTLRDFQTGILRVLLLTLDVSSSGLNLTCARNAVFFHPLYAKSNVKYTAMQKQAVGRVHRYGQGHPVRVYHLLVDDTIDSKIFEENLNIHLD